MLDYKTPESGAPRQARKPGRGIALLVAVFLAHVLCLFVVYRGGPALIAISSFAIFFVNYMVASWDMIDDPGIAISIAFASTLFSFLVGIFAAMLASGDLTGFSG